MTGWQPIDTAPRDGTVVDLWGHWPERGKWRRSADAKWDAGDWRVGGFYATDYAFPPVFTHWMALPEPPVGA